MTRRPEASTEIMEVKNTKGNTLRFIPLQDGEDCEPEKLARLRKGGQRYRLEVIEEGQEQSRSEEDRSFLTRE